jgi:hypothetical protein
VRDVSHFKSTKHAVAAAARLSQPLGYPRTKGERVIEGTGEGERLRWPIAARASMRLAGIDPDGDEALELYAWATRADGDHGEVDRLEPWDERERRASRVEGMVQALHRQLRRDGLLVTKVDVTDVPIGYRVVELDGVRHVHAVTDIEPTDIAGPGARARARRVAAGSEEGPVYEAQRVGRDERYPELAREIRPRWETGEFETLGALDEEVADRLSCSGRWAGVVRATWGIKGSRGGGATRPAAPGRDDVVDARVTDLVGSPAAAAELCD